MLFCLNVCSPVWKTKKFGLDFHSFHLLLCNKSPPCSPIKAEVKELVNGLGSNSNKPPKDDRGQPWEREKSVDACWMPPVLCLTRTSIGCDVESFKILPPTKESLNLCPDQKTCRTLLPFQCTLGQYFLDLPPPSRVPEPVSSVLLKDLQRLTLNSPAVLCGASQTSYPTTSPHAHLGRLCHL